MSHTQGPWTAHKNVVYWYPPGGTVRDGYEWIATTDRSVCLGVWSENQEKEEANARLIAAAPEMKEALVECIQALKLLAPNSPLLAIGMAQRALSKAR